MLGCAEINMYDADGDLTLNYLNESLFVELQIDLAALGSKIFKVCISLTVQSTYCNTKPYMVSQKKRSAFSPISCSSVIRH